MLYYRWALGNSPDDSSKNRFSDHPSRFLTYFDCYVNAFPH